MAKGFSYEIKEVLGDISMENPNVSYAKGVLKTILKHYDKDPGEEGIDIRRYNKQLNLPNGAGIRLTPEEAHTVADILVKNGCGSTSVLQEELEKREALYKPVQITGFTNKQGESQ